MSQPGGERESISSRFGVNSFAVLASQLLNNLLAAVVAVVLVRYFGREEYGIFTTVFTYLSFFTVFQSLGVDTIVLRDIARDPRTTGDLGGVAGLRIALSVASVVASWCFLPLIHPTPRVAGLVVLASLSAPLSFYPLYTMRHITDLRMAYPNFVFGAWSVAYTLVRLAMVAAGMSLEAFVVASLASDAIVFVLARRVGRSVGVSFRIRFDLVHARRLLAQAWPIALALIALQCLLRIDQMMLYRMRGPVEVALYAVPVRVVEFANLIPTVFVASAFPLLARLAGASDETGLAFATRTSLRAMSWCALPLGTYLFAFPEPCLRTLFGDAFAESSGVMAVLAYSLVFAFLNSIFFNRLLAAGRQNLAAVLAATAAGLNVALNIPLIRAYGGVGAAVATLVAYASVPLVSLLIVETRSVGRMVLESLLRPSACALLGLAFVERFSLGPIEGAVALAVIYCTALIVTGEIGRREAELFLKCMSLRSRNLLAA
jgi:PST family polysaccharide transporter